MYKYLVRTSQRTACTPISEAKWPMLYKKQSVFVVRSMWNTECVEKV